MPLVVTVLRVRHECPFNSLSIAFPGAEMALWCNRTNEVLEAAMADERQLGELLRKARATLKGSTVGRSDGAAFTMTRRCGCATYRSVASLADATGVWLVPPVRYFGGWETHRMLSSGKESVRRLVREIEKTGKVEVASCVVREHLNDLGGVGSVPSNLLEGLTDHQRRALVSAFEGGLLDVPARVRMGNVAAAEKLSRSTYGEHLRKAIHGIVRNCYPVLKLSEPGKGRRPGPGIPEHRRPIERRGDRPIAGDPPSALGSPREARAHGGSK